MVYTQLTNKALVFAYNAHHGQVDYNGIPYIFHPLHLAEQMEDERACCAALLHDVVEDTCLTLEDLRREFPEEVVQIVALLTHDAEADRDSSSYFDYLRPIKAHPIARKIKLADIAHNADQSRCIGCGIPAEKLARWAEKYEKARAFLLEEE